MPSSRTIPACDGSPVQGPGHNVNIDNLDCPPRTFHTSPNALISSSPRLQCDDGSSGTSPTPTPLTTSPAATVKRLDPTFNVVAVAADHGSPTKQRSPLRQSLSYSEPPEISPTTPDRLSISSNSNNTSGLGVIFDFSPTRKRNKMSYTGDSRSTGANTRNRTPTWRKTSLDGGSQSQLGSSPDITPTQQAKSYHGIGSQATTPKTASPTASSRFAFFASSLTALKGRSTSNPIAVPQDDELMHMDIEDALYPTGAAGNGDTFSPAAYKNLQMTATGLLHRFQSAYQQRTIEYQELKAERGVQNEEKDEAETRMHHLRIQLEGMARKAAEQEAIMQSLMGELAMEKKLRAEERQAREKCVSVSGDSTLSEDLGVEEDQNRRQWRRSVCTAKSDMSFETDEESVEGASVFSRSRSPTIATTITEVGSIETPSLPQIRTPTSPTPRTPRSAQPQMNTFQKLFKGIAGDASAESRGPVSCRNCSGQDASVAWDTVTLLKDENKGLKDRVGELETAVEGALDIVNGLGTKRDLV